AEVGGDAQALLAGVPCQLHGLLDAIVGDLVHPLSSSLCVPAVAQDCGRPRLLSVDPRVTVRGSRSRSATAARSCAVASLPECAAWASGLAYSSYIQIVSGSVCESWMR